MKVSVETLSPIEKKLTIEVPAERVTEALEKAYKGLARQVKVPGFRPGKVPRRILEGRFREQVEQEVAQDLVEHTYREAVGEHELFPVGSPAVSPEKLEGGKSFKFEARVEVKPELAPRDYKGLEFTAPKADVDEAAIDAELAKLQEGMASLVPVEDRQAAIAGDHATVDFVGTIDGAEFEGGKGEGVTVEVQPGTMLDGHAPFLAGVTVGETVNTDVEFPETFPEEKVRGKKAVFAVTLKGIKARKVPTIDDEFVKDLGGEAKTVPELRTNIRENLEKQAKAAADRSTREQLVRALIAKNPFDVPKSMIERAIDVMMMGAAERFARQGIDIRQLGLDFRKLREDLRERATEEVRGALLLEAIARLENIQVTDDDLSEHYRKVAAEAGIAEAKVRAHFEKDGEEKSGLRSRLQEDRAYDLVRREAKQVEAKPEVAG